MKILERIKARQEHICSEEKPKYWLILYFVVFLVWFFVLEKRITQDYYVSYIPFDDKIPFCEYFILVYVLWYPLLAAAGFYLMFTDGKYFNRYLYFIAIGFSLCLAFCAVFPNGQELRPDVFPRENFCTWLVSLIYAADTNTNVLPSMHVVGCAAVSSAVFGSKKAKRWAAWLFTGVGVFISISTVFVKQHSILDVLAALIVCVPIYILVYRPFRRKNDR